MKNIKSIFKNLLVLSSVMWAVSVGLLFPNPSYALSCINPTEMVDRYVTEPDYSIALIEAGAVETEGSQHDQTITVQETYKGSVADTVSFTYDDTWQYLCAGSPAEAGTEAVYITNDQSVVQVVSLDSPLYSNLMTALEETEPTVEEEPTPKPERRALMMRIVDLLQQLINLLQGESVEPVELPPQTEPEPTFIGMTVSEAEVFATETDTLFRVVKIDGEPQPTTKDFRPGRINATVENGVVVDYTVEGEEPEEPTTGEHDAIIGMSQTEAEAYAIETDVRFRSGRIDDED